MDFRHDRVPMRVIGQRPGASTQTIAPTGSRGDDPNLYLHLLAFSDTEVFVKLNGLAVNDAVGRSNHLEISRMPTQLYLPFRRLSYRFAAAIFPCGLDALRDRGRRYRLNAHAAFKACLDYPSARAHGLWRS